MEWNKLLQRDKIYLDGAMGTMLQKKGMKTGEIPELLNIKNPSWITNIHREYIDAGADIIYANTFGANSRKLKGTGYCVSEVIKAGIDNAREAVKGTDTLVALDIGPIGELLEPTGMLKFEEAYDIYKEEVLAGGNADLIVFETMTDLYELKAGVLAAKENTDLPVICTMTFEENRRTFTGVSIENMALTLEGLGVDAIGINCSLGPKEFYPLIKKLTQWTNLPLIAKPNAGLPDPRTNEYNITPDEFAEQMEKLAALGVKFYGGCCGTNPTFIKVLKEKIKTAEIGKRLPCKKVAVCSSTQTVEINEPRIIGERINPTGKKIFKQALIEHNIDYILGQAVEQVKAGADILDVNVGLPDIDESKMMVEVIKSLQSITEVPLQIDSSDLETLEGALRVYNGKPIVNSVNGEDEVLDKILPLVKKYGAMVIGLTLDRRGIPKKAEERLAIAEKIKNRCLDEGIDKENIVIDCLTLTASAEQEAVLETLKAVNLVKNKLHLRTVLGVSNISFGLPDRELINRTFLTMALTNGLDLCIINPNIPSMTGAVRAYKLLQCIDKNSVDYIKNYNGIKNETSQGMNQQIDIFYAIENGLKSEGGRITKGLLKEHEPMDIVNNMLIPALDKTGADFESGKIYLPQLILSANVAETAFAEIKNYLLKTNNNPISKGKIVLATVKGDIHDIGKNIVKVLLENYGYTVIDLGKDVDYDEILNAVKENNVKLVGLSALMTTTIKNMEKTIKLFRENKLDCKIMVGGAVLTKDYAMKIGADFYAEDAKQSVDIAKKILG